ncbi:hypothetical protein DYB25_004872 [Aphanomyces astaci]|uniref:Uncharacterized protein n=1 Tax=Aphanomyces astaci TaxID=112090 RepID=A0A397A2P3_APHAT|nr:hypothetical protein DYB36_004389 [Aphanomyces astaci]RHY08312.1 hypothetical protein DYB25_004872 [Aphanomyces astaci]RHY55578.1 hypothetical protein DYB34_009050 [Aphanomyces astaci]RHY56832.1 hypothetical protein DYB30_002030 [Aphanomyces astaci]RHY59525.1 hypothetical protein DYB38_006399 [Aphanomyces astaci]
MSKPRRTQLMVFASDLTFGLAPVVHRGEIMGIDKMTTLTMPPMHVVLDDFGEMETDNNSIVKATTVTEAVISSPTCRVSNEFQHLSSDVQALDRLLHEKLPVTSAVPDDTRPRLEALRQENQLLHDCVSSLVHDKTLLQDRVLLLEARIDHDSV